MTAAGSKVDRKSAVASRNTRSRRCQGPASSSPSSRCPRCLASSLLRPPKVTVSIALLLCRPPCVHSLNEFPAEGLSHDQAHLGAIRFL